MRAALFILFCSAMFAQQSPNYCAGCERDAQGKIKRSETAKQDFRKANPCPSTGKTRGACPGFEIDHRQPLAKGGRDSATNMQWLSKEQHKQKTRQDFGSGSSRRGSSYSYGKPSRSYGSARASGGSRGGRGR